MEVPEQASPEATADEMSEEASDILSPLNPNRMAAHRHGSVAQQPLTPGVASGIVASANIENKGLRKGRWRKSIGGTPCRGDVAHHRTDPVERLLVASVTKHRRWTALSSPAASEASTTDAWSDAELSVVTD